MACKKEAATPADDKTNKIPESVAGVPVLPNYYQIPAPGHSADGANIAITDINGNGKPDIFLMIEDAPVGPNQYRYVVAYDVNENGVATTVSGVKYVQAPGDYAEGSGMAIGDIDRNGVPDLILMSYDAPPGPNQFRYKVGLNLNINGDAALWTNYYTIPGVSDDGQGAAIALGDIDDNGLQDLILVAGDGPATGELRYQIAFNLNNVGQASTVLPAGVTLNHVASYMQGVGVALADLNGDRKQEVFFMGYDNPLGPNEFRCLTGTFNKQGVLESRSNGYESYTGICDESQGAGIAVYDIDRDGIKDMVFMADDNPPGANAFRYYVGFQLTKNRIRNTWVPAYFN
ncbi:FG-GAP repeat domain-containing protein [Chitinophaga nivalis]|uniref:VCBS repeat-containing protein n=1 Tax=Chitinophaga nivalis TaxID=2991709 RepID=A0ABT3IKB6_9BACT|nr:VCBS repeat-containing protein [Chitinophaga nivalis]MCW3465899.1 VCBS repeat-containing protein [Chitinophaga nivalis]MCW3484410.1 VCBS repeat-containing protein [Chitinophaga nivalis]